MKKENIDETNQKILKVAEKCGIDNRSVLLTKEIIYFVKEIYKEAFEEGKAQQKNNSAKDFFESADFVADVIFLFVSIPLGIYFWNIKITISIMLAIAFVLKLFSWRNLKCP